MTLIKEMKIKYNFRVRHDAEWDVDKVDMKCLSCNYEEEMELDVLLEIAKPRAEDARRSAARVAAASSSYRRTPTTRSREGSSTKSTADRPSRHGRPGFL